MPKQPYHNQTAARTLAVLERLAERGGAVPLTDLAAALECSKSSLFPILRTMEEAGFVRRISSGGYVLTSHLLDLGTRSMNPRHIHRAFDDASAPAVATGGELMLLAVLDGPWAVCVATRAPGGEYGGPGNRVGAARPGAPPPWGRHCWRICPTEDIPERVWGERPSSARRARPLYRWRPFLESLNHVPRVGCPAAGAGGGLRGGRRRHGDRGARPARRRGRRRSGSRCQRSEATPEAWAKLRRLLLGAAADIASRIGGAPAAVL